MTDSYYKLWSNQGRIPATKTWALMRDRVES